MLMLMGRAYHYYIYIKSLVVRVRDRTVDFWDGNKYLIYEIIPILVLKKELLIYYRSVPFDNDLTLIVYEDECIMYFTYSN